MIAQLHQGLKDVKRRVFMAIGRGVLTAIDDSKKLQEVQLELLDGEVADQIERFQQYGLTSAPFEDAEAIMVSVGGLRLHGIVIAVDDRRYRLTGLTKGEVALYDDQGQKVHLQRDQILITTTKKVTIHSDVEVDVTAPKVVVTSDDVNLGAEGGAAVARVGDPVAGGVITAGSGKVKAA